MSTARLHLQTLYVLDERGRIVSTREPEASPGPLFALARGAEGCAWAVRVDVSDDLAEEVERLAREEAPALDLRDGPMHAERYTALLGGRAQAGPAFAFPDDLESPSGTVLIEDEALLDHHFRGWVPGEIAAGRAPVVAIVQGSYPVSVCFSARWSPVAAEAGVETAPPFRGRGFGAWVTAAWALAVRATGRTPLYSTEWSNTASLALARTLDLRAYAAGWSLWE
jgi:GNAT superfamily N-acetyltransferase